MRKKLGFSLKFKIILLICSLLLAALGSYAWFAIDLFQKDKTAYVYESSLYGLEQLQSRLEQNLTDTQNQLLILEKILQSKAKKENVQNYIKDSGNILGLIVFETTGQVDPFLHLSSQTKELINSDLEVFETLIKKKFQNYLSSPPLQTNYLLNPLHEEFETLGPHLLTIKGLPEKDQIIFFITDLNFLVNSLKQQRIFDYVLRDQTERIVSVVNQNQTPQNKLKEIFKLSFGNENDYVQSVQNIELGPNESYLVAKQELEDTKIQIVSLINYDQAFAAARFLTKQSFYIALLILSLTIMTAIIFSKTLTRPLERLYQATLKIAQGDFNTQVDVTGRDEISSLGHSFNFMSQKILMYIEEMKEKNRLENELAVAKLVQDSFFPPPEVDLKNLKLSSFYTPATECGGDWWGYIHRNDRTILIIADATGHGVPAAFLTATVHSCIQTLDQVSKNHPELIETPEKILEFMNETVSRIGKDILLTSFVIIFEHKTSQIFYSNASHLDALILRVPMGETPHKGHLIPLLEAKGPRLGHEKRPQFQSAKHDLQDKDVLILWTDGITEAENPQGKQWGQRNFLKSILSAELDSSQKIRENIINQLLTFNQEKPFEDDVTLICAVWENS